MKTQSVFLFLNNSIALGREYRGLLSNNKMIDIYLLFIFHYYHQWKRRWDDRENCINYLGLFERSRNLIQVKRGLQFIIIYSVQETTLSGLYILFDLILHCPYEEVLDGKDYIFSSSIWWPSSDHVPGTVQDIGNSIMAKTCFLLYAISQRMGITKLYMGKYSL